MSIKLNNPHTINGRVYCESVVTYMQTGTKNPIVLITPSSDKTLHVIDGIVDTAYDVKSITFIESGQIIELIGFKNKIEVKIKNFMDVLEPMGKVGRVGQWKDRIRK